jgi:phage recombination protein Bet
MKRTLKTIEPPSLTFTRDQIDLIKQTVARGSTDAELQLFLYTAKRSGLDPLLKQVHAIKRWDSAAGKETMAIQTGIDGYRLVAGRTGQHMGTSDVEYDREDAEHPTWAKITVFREVNGRVCEFPATARWKEYAAYKKDGQPMALWKKMPYLMLGKCAEALAIRKAFPQELAGIYTFEEMDQPAGADIQVAAPQIPNNDKEQQPSEVKKEEQTVLLGPEKSPEKPAKKRRLAVVEERTDTPEKAQSNYARLLEFLHLGKYTGADFLMVAHKNKWISERVEKLTDVPDPDLAEFLKPDNREIIMEQLDKMPRHVKD